MPRLEEILARREANVREAGGYSERSRWQANIDLCRATLAHVGKFDRQAALTMNGMHGSMKLGVAGIGEKQEQERWRINARLWKETLARKGK